MEKFFYAPSSWDLGKAEEHARHIGLETKWEGSKLLIEKRYHKAEFNWQGAEDDIPDWPGYYMDMDPCSWNGWDNPHFNKKVVEKLMAWCNDPKNGAEDPESTTFRWDGEDLIVMYGEGYGPLDEERITPQVIKVNNKQVTVYQMQLGWTWVKTEKV